MSQPTVIQRNSPLSFKIDKILQKFCQKFDKITETSDEIFEKFVWNICKILFVKFSSNTVLKVSRVKFIGKKYGKF